MKVILSLFSCCIIFSQNTISQTNHKTEISNFQESLEENRITSMGIGIGIGNKTGSLSTIFNNHLSFNFEYNKYFASFTIGFDMALMFHPTIKDHKNSIYHIKEDNSNSLGNFHLIFAYDTSLNDYFAISPFYSLGTTILSESSDAPSAFGPAKLSYSYGLNVDYKNNEEMSLIRFKYQIHDINYGTGAKGLSNTLVITFVKLLSF